ncbi:MAG: methyltransferase domain-containing protein [Phenylobacterium sp.]
MLADPCDENSLSVRFRRRRDIRLRALIDRVHAERGRVRILDMGGALEYWGRVGIEYLKSRGAFITIVNQNVSAVSEKLARPELFATAVGDACNLTTVKDQAFDLAHSNSVIEHVMTWDNMKRFAAETRRVAPYYYVQTPNFWFPIDPHFYKFPFFHWMPRPVRARLLNVLPIGHRGRIHGVDIAYGRVDYARLLDSRQFRHLFPDATIHHERIAGLTKSLIAARWPGQVSLAEAASNNREVKSRIEVR